MSDKIERLIPGIRIEAFRPNPADRSLETNLNLLLLMKDFGGRGSIRFYKALRAGGILRDDQAEGFNRHTFRAIAHYYALPPHIDPQEFYMQNQKHAKGVPEYFAERLPEIEKLQLKDEISTLSDKPSNLFGLLSKDPGTGSINPTLSYEAYRHALLLDLSSGNQARTLNGRLLTRLSDVLAVLDERTYAGPLGAGSDFVMQSIHDDETNQVIGFPETFRRIPLTAHLKSVTMTVRQIRGLGLVYSHPRKKDDQVSMIKAIAKAQKNGGLIKLDSDVQDPIGLTITSVDDSVTPEEVAKRVVADLTSDDRLKIKASENDDACGLDHGQAAEKSFCTRRLIWFDDISVPLELIFSDRETYLNGRFEVGHRDPKTGLYQGRSHKLFEIRRESIVAPILFPPELYPDTSSAFINRSKREAQELREMSKAT